MAPVWLLLLFSLPLLLKAQETPDLVSGAPVEVENSTDSLTTSTGSSNSTSSPTEPSGFEPTPSGAPTEEEDWSPAEAFLYSGDPYALEPARCSRAYSPPEQTRPPPERFSDPLRPALDALANTANFLNMIFQASDLRESTVREDMEWYHALVRALLEADTLIRQALLTFDADPTAAAPQLVLRAARNPAAKVQTVVLQDLSKAWESLHPPAPAPDDRWFTSFKFPESNQPLATLSKRVLLNDLGTMDSPKWGQGDSYVTSPAGVRWASAPFLDCKDGRFVPGWMLTLSTSFYGLKPDLTPEFRGVVRVDVNIQDIDVNQCETGDGWFADTHQCNRTTMECQPVPGRGFRLGQYCCRCKEGYYNPELATRDADGGLVNGTHSGSWCYPNIPVCLPCWPDCKSCRDGAPCWVQEDWFLRTGVLAIQGVFMLLVFVSMLVAYRHRRSRRIRASGLLLLETILFGSLLLYFPVFILYFKPSTFRCILLRWVRTLGFSIVYGTVMLKMYRVLKLFLSRTAQRVPYMSSLYLLRILGVMLVTVSWFLCAWTAGVLQNRDRNIPVFIASTTSDGQGFNLCSLDRWDYMMAVAELLFLCWGSSLWSAVRPVPSAFHEPRYMGIAIHNELLLSSMFHLLRFTFPSLHPDWMLLFSFTHTHVTVTVTLALLFIPKFHYVSKPGREEIAAEVYEEEVDLRLSGSYLNSSFHSAWSEHSVDPEDFRDELKKLYTQLEVNKTKKMTTNNPHLLKKRSSRYALGRSIIKRISEIPETMSRQCSRDEKEGSQHSKSVTQSECSNRAPDTASITYKSSIKTPSPVMRKSQSDHHYVHERDSSLRDSMLSTNAAKRVSQQSETNSLDIPPGVCKSASAQNLTVDTNLLHPDHTRLHKTRSLSSTSTHTMQDVPKINRACTMVTKSRENITISDQVMNVLQSQSYDKSEVCPWEVEQPQPVDKNQRHVTYAPSQGDDDDAKTPPSPVTLVCPWDHLPPLQKNPSVEKSIESDCESPKPQAPVSASAPASPRPKITKDQRVFSFRNTSTKWLAVKAFMGSTEGGNRNNSSIDMNKEDSVSQKSHESSASATPRLTASRNPSLEKRRLQKRSMTTAEGKPCLVKQNAVRLSSGDYTDRSPRKLVIVKSAVCPWDVDDLQKDGTYENVFLSRQNSKRSSICSWEAGGSASRTPSTHRRGSNRMTPVRNVSHGDVCPWDAPGEAPKKQQSIKADVCPWETQSSERSSVCPWESQEQETGRGQSARGDVCPWESQDIPIISNNSVSQHTAGSQETRQSLTRATDICPWESSETPQSSKRQDSGYANVCPWEVQDKAEVIYENLNPVEMSGTVPSRQEALRPAIYPSAPKEMLLNEQQCSAKTPVLHLATQVPKTADSCPWDFPDPPKIITDICPWEQDKPEETRKDVSPLKTASVQIEGKDSTRVNVCPWEQPEKPSTTKMISQGAERLADVCPWETEEPETCQTNASKTAGNERQDTTRANVCPWEVEGPETAKSEVSEAPQKLQRQENPQEDVCPWETPETKVVKKQDSSQSNSCPRKSEDTKDAKKQDSVREDVCPWETEDPKGFNKQESARADVCPWEAEKPEVVKTQESARADVCPWEAEKPEVVKTQESARADVCPWEAEKPEVVKTQEGARADVCPWEAEKPEAVKTQESARADVCPWETEKPEVVKTQESARADVCPWETADPRVVKSQGSTGAEVCSGDFKDLRKSSESKVDILCDKEEPMENQGALHEEDPPLNISTQPVANSPLGRRDALCPWEMARSRSGSYTDNCSDVFTWEPENIPEEDEDDDAECAAEALVFPPDL